MWTTSRASKLVATLARSGVQRQAIARVNTEALKFMALGTGALLEADRILPYTRRDDARLHPLLKTAKENFEMALEVEGSNSDAMLFLSRLYMYYHIPGTSPASGAALLEAAADAGNSVAQYELACRLRAEGKILGIGHEGDGMDDRALEYFELAACKKHPGALFLMGSMYMAGEHMEQDVKAAAWCFRNAAEQGNAAAATVYGALVAKGLVGNAAAGGEQQHRPNAEDEEAKSTDSPKMELEDVQHPTGDGAQNARHYFEVAAEAGDALALEWLAMLDGEERPSQSGDVSADGPGGTG